MKNLYGTADLEAAVFEMENGAEDQGQEIEYILGEGTAEDYAELEKIFRQEADDFPSLELNLELTDGRTLEYEVVSVFVHGEKEYIGLHPKSDTEGLIHIMQLTQGENDEIELLPIKDEEELQNVCDMFFKLYADDFEDEAPVTTEIKEPVSEKSTSRRFHVR